MRGTLHLVAATDVAWLLSLFGPRFATRGPEPKRLAEMGLDGETVEESVEALVEVLEERGPLTRDELATALLEQGVDLDPKGQGPNFLIRRAALRGRLCEVGWAGRQGVYDRLEAWLPPEGGSSDRETALSRLVRRYVAAFGPATLGDFVAWSGLTVTDARGAWEAADGTVELTLGGTPMLAIEGETEGSAGSEPNVRLLPAYDSYLLGYAPENRPIDDAYRSRVWPGGGVIRPTVVVDGIVRGTWRLERSRTVPVVEVSLFEPLDGGLGGLEAEAADVGRFLGLAEPELVVEGD